MIRFLTHPLKKGFAKICFIFFLCSIVCTSQLVFASDTPLVVFDGDQEAFLYNQDKNNFGDAFLNIAPGETRTFTFTLQNTHKKTLDFYFQAKALSDLQELKGAVYHIVFTKGTDTIFSQTFSDTEGGLQGFDTKGTLGEQYLITSLATDESLDISMNLTLDGNATGNAYQNSDATLQFILETEYNAPDTKKPSITNPITSQNTSKTSTLKNFRLPKTGDSTNIAFLLFLCAVSGMILFFVIYFRRKKQ